MMELLTESIALINLPFTVLLVIVLIYWLMTIMGVVGADALSVDAPSADMHLDAPSADLHFDAPAGDLHLDGHGAGLDADIAHAKSGTAHVEAGAMAGLLNFVNATKVPLMIVLSLFIFSLWVGQLVGNHFLNPGKSVMLALGILVPNYIVSIFATKLLTMPLVPLFAIRAGAEPETNEGLIGSRALLRTDVDGARLGQAELVTDRSEFRLNVESVDGERIPRGSQVTVVNYDEQRGVYKVRL